MTNRFPNVATAAMAILSFGLAAAMSVSTASANVVFSDSTYNPADYTQAFTYANPVPPGNASVFTAVPGTGLQFTIGTNGPTSSTNVAILNGVLNSTFTYNPATSGAISSITASSTKTFTVSNPDPTAASVSFNNNFRPLIAQDGFYYTAAIPGTLIGPVAGGSTQTVGPELLSNTLTTSSFFLIDPATGTITGSHGSLNFAGDTLTFGLVQLLGSGGTPVTATTKYQDLTYSIASVSAVPLPASAPMFGAALMVLGALGFALGRMRDVTAA